MNANALIAELTQREPPLRPSTVWKGELSAKIESCSRPALYIAGLHLFNDDLDRCHNLAQADENPTGNYWHAIMHRREGDYANSLYWYRRVGDHPVLSTMREKFPGWSARQFVRSCEEDVGGESTLLRQQQAEEMRLLLAYCDGRS